MGFEGRGYQVRDALHPRDLIPLLQSQMSDPGAGKDRVLNISGGRDRSMSLRQLSHWCAERFGAHDVVEDATPRQYDVPWLVLSAARAKAVWGWEPKTDFKALVRMMVDADMRE